MTPRPAPSPSPSTDDVARPGLRSRLRSLRPVMRLALRDALAHKARSLLAILLVALPLVLVVGNIGRGLSTPPSRQTALASIPTGAQAIVTGTAVDPAEGPFPQIPEGAPGFWFNDSDVVPLGAQGLASIIPAQDHVIQYWISDTFLATTGMTAQPGEVGVAGAGDLEAVNLSTIGTLTLQESSAEGITLLLPELSAGAAPTDADGIVITSALAERTGAEVGDTLSLMAPPLQAGADPDTDDEVLHNSQRAYRVTGIVADAEQSLAWAQSSWLASTATADPAGVDTHFLIAGPEPVTWEMATQMNTDMAFAVSRHVLTHYPADDELYPVEVSPEVLTDALISTIIAAAVEAGLLLALITPAFAVAAEQQRRMLALASACGATPRQLARTLTLQGVMVGCLGGLLGAGGGVVAVWAAWRMFYPDTQALVGFPWWMLAVAVVGAGAAGWLATLFPARRVARMDPVEALRRHSAYAASGRRSRWSGARWRVGAGLVLIALAVGCGVGSVRAPIPREMSAGGMLGLLPGGASAPLLVAALLLGATALILLAPLILDVGIALLIKGPLALRLAAREADAHRGRTLPVIAAIAVVVAVGCGQVVNSASYAANYNDTSLDLEAPGHLSLGMRVSIDDRFDAHILRDGVQVLADAGLPVTGSGSVWSPTYPGLSVDVVPPVEARCPYGSEPDALSSLGLREETTCVPWGKGYNPGYSAVWIANDSVLILEGDTLRASGLEGAEQAAQVLDAGGVVVGFANWIADDGTVQIGAVRQDGDGVAQPEDTQSKPGYFMRWLPDRVAISPETAAGMGLVGDDAPAYLGEVVKLSRPLTSQEEKKATDLLDAHSALVIPATDWIMPLWGDLFDQIQLVVLVVIALFTLGLSLLLTRTQMRGDLITMHAVGAGPGFLRRVTAAHAAVVLAVGVPLGALGGWAVGLYLVAWNRHVAADGPWLRTEGLWGWQILTLACFVAIGMALAWLAGRPPTSLERSRDE
ncbi:FtsX-like permease family protein [Actinomyces sp. MRS3W]|uniref:FtsX-like permease family protein n=1 Tax=Actinomyces sp. MRS3W TaxID=2800796 RepID=UPI0028FD50ED|nr:FtsX-like permease family protein [Actinomyces sp. MRS3W]MDU0347403.1 FtsX-like permease family protein [Actinomyces sp. MRS3W]